MKVHLEIELLSANNEEINLEARFVDEDGEIREREFHSLISGDVVAWKKFTREFNLD